MSDKNINYPLKLLLGVPAPWVYALVYLLGIALQYIIPINFPPLKVFLYLGIILYAAGGVIASMGFIVFEKNSNIQVSGVKSKQLVTVGLYKYSRNPLFLGLFLAYLGEASLVEQIWPVILLPFLFAYINYLVVPAEEETLSKTYGRKYEQYCLAVRRWL